MTTKPTTSLIQSCLPRNSSIDLLVSFCTPRVPPTNAAFKGIDLNDDNGGAGLNTLVFASNRAPGLPGGWNGDANNAFSKSGRTAEQAKFFDFSSKLFTWRKTKSVIHSGKTTHYIPENNVYVYFRHNDSESVMVVINNSTESKTFKTNRFQENISKYKSGKDVLSDKSFDLKNDIQIEGKSVLILELK